MIDPEDDVPLLARNAVLSSNTVGAEPLTPERIDQVVKMIIDDYKKKPYCPRPIL